MDELLSGTAVVLSLVAIIAVLSLAHELGLVREQLHSPPSLDHHNHGTPMSHATRALAGAAIALPPAHEALLLFALRDCAPCERVLESLAGSPAIRSFVYLIALADPDVARRWADTSGLAADRVVADVDGSVARQFGVSAFPTVVATRGGRVLRAVTVPSMDDLALLAVELGRTPAEFVTAAPGGRPRTPVT
jgi:hypothetical protein